jgi:hypothetical protein
MRNETIGVIDAALRTDGSITELDRSRLVMQLKDGLPATVPDRILRRQEVARLLGRSPKSVDRLAVMGTIRKVVFPGCKRAAGYRMNDIASLIAGHGGEV